MDNNTINFNFNFPKIYKKRIIESEVYSLFNCPKCGFHPDVIR